MALPVAEMITEFARPCVRDFQGFDMDDVPPGHPDRVEGVPREPAGAGGQPEFLVN